VHDPRQEWVRPGCFLPFCNQQLLGSAQPEWPLTRRDGLHVNVSVGWTSALGGLILWRKTPAVAAVVLWIEAGNTAMHTGMAMRKRRAGARAAARPSGGRSERDVVDGRLPLLGSEARPQGVHVLERELVDALVGDRAPRPGSRCPPRPRMGIAFASAVCVSA
jgi:hypothetical protein